MQIEQTLFIEQLDDVAQSIFSFVEQHDADLCESLHVELLNIAHYLHAYADVLEADDPIDFVCRQLFTASKHFHRVRSSFEQKPRSTDR